MAKNYKFVITGTARNITKYTTLVQANRAFLKKVQAMRKTKKPGILILKMATPPYYVVKGAVRRNASESVKMWGKGYKAKKRPAKKGRF